MKKTNYISDPSDKRVDSILNTVQFLSSITTAADIEIQHDLTDTKFKNNRPLNNHIRNIKIALDGINREVSVFGKVKQRDDFTYEYGIEMHRLISHFHKLPTEQIRKFMDGVESIKQ